MLWPVNFAPHKHAMRLEFWRPVVGYEGLYEVSSLGRIRGLKKTNNRLPGRILKPALNSRGYQQISFFKEGKLKTYILHRVVACAFLGEQPTPIHQVNHKNSLRDDNCVENLEWVTPSENMLHAFRDGFKSNKADKAPSAKLNWDQVEEIRRLHIEGHKGRAIAKVFNVTESCISNIVNNKQWVV